MNIKMVMLLLLVASGLEIFINIITIFISKGISIFNKDFHFSEKRKNTVKIIFVIIFMISVIYFLFEAVKVLAFWLGIPLDMRILEMF